MKPKNLVKLSNIIGTVAIILLLYWVFIFSAIEIFGLRIFRENLTQTFYMSILGVLALMVGALIINIMFNLTRIAEKHNQDGQTVIKWTNKIGGWLLVLSFPIIGGLLYYGDYYTAKKKQEALVQSAASVIEIHKEKIGSFVNYSFDEAWIIDTEEALDIIGKTDDNFPHINVIVQDSVKNLPTYLRFDDYYNGKLEDDILPEKKNFILPSTLEERTYLSMVFDEGILDERYTAHDGRYELFYPYQEGDKIIVLHFSAYQRYGKY